MESISHAHTAHATPSLDQGWEKFTTAVISTVAKQKEGIIFICWGRPAQKLVMDTVRNKSAHHIICSSHPSPLGAYKNLKQTKKAQAAPAFLGSKCFSKVNDLLKAKGETPIDWGKLPR